MINDKICTKGSEKKAVLPVRPNIKVFTTFNFSGPIKSEQNEWLEPENIRVSKVAVLSAPILISRKQLHVVGDAETKI